MNVRWKDDISAWLSFTRCLCIGHCGQRRCIRLFLNSASTIRHGYFRVYTVPVLRRLQKADYLTTYDQPYQGRNRRYYQITEDGRIRLLELLKEWRVYKEKVDCVLLGGNIDG